MRIIRAIVAGERNPAVLATYRDVRCHSSIETFRAALVGNDRDEHLFALPSRCYQAKMLDCDRKLEALMAALSHPDSGLALVESTRADDIEKTGGTPQASGGYVYGPRAFEVPGHGFPKPRRVGRQRGGVLVIARAEKSPAEAEPTTCSIADRGNRGRDPQVLDLLYVALGRSFLSIPKKTSGRLSASHLR
jgi:hypothetical protein